MKNARENSKRTPRRFVPLIWIGLTQMLAVAGSWAVVSGGNFFRLFALGSVTLALAAPLMFSLEAGLTALVLFEPFRGLLRRAQYLFVPYSDTEPIHLVTPVVTALGLLLVLMRQKLEMFRATPLAGAVSVLAFICLLQIFNPLQGGLYVGLTGALFHLVPMAWFYFGQAADESLFPRLWRLVVCLALITSLYGVYQIVAGYPAFELYWLENTDKYSSVTVYNVKRALATFSNAEEWGRYVLLGCLAAFGFASMRSEGGRRRVFWLLCALSLCGMLALTGQRTSIFGLFLGLGVFFVTGARTASAALGRAVLVCLPFVLLFSLSGGLTEDDIYELEEDRKVSTILSHTTRGTIDPTGEGSLYSRLETWGRLVTEVIPSNPLGAGLGARTVAATRAVEDGSKGAIDNYFLIFAVSAGVPALLLLLWILFRAFAQCVSMWRAAEPGSDERVLARTVMALLTSFILNNFFGTSFVIYSVAPLGWFLLGWISRKNSEQ